MSNPFISVVIPTFHRNDLLAQCLDRLAPGVQTLPTDRYEVIVADDGSKSTARSMIQEFYPWARWVEGPRRGPAANRNFGATRARGEFVAFIDDDCLPSSGWLQAYAEAADVESVDIYEGKTVCEAGIHSPLNTSPINLSGGYLWSCNMMVRREVFLELGGFDESFPSASCEDIDFRERLKARGYRFPFVERAMVDHPPRPNKRGALMGATQENQVRLWYLTGSHGATGWRLVVLIARARAREVLRADCDRNLWLWSSLAELAHVALHVRAWDRKHRLRLTSSTKPKAERAEEPCA